MTERDSGPAANWLHMTAVFAFDGRAYEGNPFHADTPFGRPQGIAAGDLLTENMRLEALLQKHGIDPSETAELSHD